MKDTFRKEYQPLKESNSGLIFKIKESAEQLEDLMRETNPSRELSLAITNLEQAVMWAVKAVCINNDGQIKAEKELSND
jgi:hypothetical protein